MAVRNLVLGAGIFVVYVLMLAYGIEAFYASPRYETFCNGTLGGMYPSKSSITVGEPSCNFSRVVQEQSEQCYAGGGQPIYQYTDTGCTESLRECNYCSKYFNEAQQAHTRIVFFIAFIAGIITLFIGYALLAIEPVGSALMASGIGAIFYGSARNWENLSDIWRFLLLLFALLLLIWIAVRVNRREKKKWWQFWKR